MGRYRPRATNKGGEEVGGLAGWLFTDLLLGLVFIFLAISTPFAVGALSIDDTGGSPVTVPCEPRERTYYETSFRKTYVEISQATSITDDMRVFASMQNPPLEKYEVAVAIIQGAYLSGEPPRAGQARAFEFYQRMTEKDPVNFPVVSGFTQRDTRDEKVRFGGAPAGSGEASVPIRGAVVELFFVYDPSNC